MAGIPENDKNQFVILSAEVLDLPMGTVQKVLVRITDVTAEFARQQELWSFHQTVQPAPENIKELLKMMIDGDGITLAPDQLAAVWQPYYQVEKVFSGNISGMGLGLSVVAKLVWEVGGKCRIYNRVGQQGVVVELVLPIL